LSIIRKYSSEKYSENNKYLEKNSDWMQPESITHFWKWQHAFLIRWFSERASLPDYYKWNNSSAREEIYSYSI
jgi:hypothetical protein